MVINQENPNMKNLFVILLAAFLLPSFVVAQDEKKEVLMVGKDAPNWEMVGSDGKTYQLSDFKGKKPVVVAWYPMALTGG